MLLCVIKQYQRVLRLPVFSLFRNVQIVTLKYATQRIIDSRGIPAVAFQMKMSTSFLQLVQTTVKLLQTLVRNKYVSRCLIGRACLNLFPAEFFTPLGPNVVVEICFSNSLRLLNAMIRLDFR